MPEVTESTVSKRRRDWCNCCEFLFRKTKRVHDQEPLSDDQVLKAADIAYAQELSEPLKPGSCITIRATIRPQCRRFAVNFLHVRGPKTDIVFHFNPRLALRYIVRNSRINNSWGDEETTSVEKFHLDRNKTFELQIVASEQEYLVALDGHHICAYVYRVPLDKVNKIEVEGIEVEGINICKQIKMYPSVEGSIDVESVHHNQTSVYPTTSLKSICYSVPMRDGLDGDSSTEQQLIVPLTADLPKGFNIGWQLEIIGRVKILPSAFYINLQKGKSLWPHPIIPLHLNPRFYTSYGNHLFVRNSWIDGEWGIEERTAGFQFTPGKTFHLAIRMNSDSFGVWIDGTLAGEFRFRTPVDAIDTLYIHGDVQIKSVFLRDHVDDQYFSKSREKINSNL